MRLKPARSRRNHVAIFCDARIREVLSIRALNLESVISDNPQIAYAYHSPRRGSATTGHERDVDIRPREQRCDGLLRFSGYCRLIENRRDGRERSIDIEHDHEGSARKPSDGFRRQRQEGFAHRVIGVIIAAR